MKGSLDQNDDDDKRKGKNVEPFTKQTGRIKSMGFDLPDMNDKNEDHFKEDTQRRQAMAALMPYRRTPDNQVTPIKFKAIKLAKLKEHIQVMEDFQKLKDRLEKQKKV